MSDFPVHADRLDCLQANLALLADRHHGAGTHLRLGATLRFAPRPAPAGSPTGLATVEPTLDQHLDDAADLLGLAVAERRRHAPGSPVEVDAPLYVVADAHHLPWGPYHGTKHVEHSFLVEPDGDGLAIGDAYHNDTQWGPARPLRRGCSRADFAALIAALPEGVESVRFAPRALAAPPEPRYLPGPVTATEYLRGYAEHPDRRAALEAFTLETWLLARSRRLHALYAAERAGEPLGEDVQLHLGAWDALVEHAYLAFRRVDRGRAEPGGLWERAAQALHADTAAFAVRGAVRATVSSVLGIAEGALETGVLTVHPEFNSLRMVEIVETLEDRFAVEFDPADLVPENLQHIESLSALVRRALGDAKNDFTTKRN
ncbi:acyl carrier protein [Streptomyces sp. NPDC098789]|uniref:acyl carrier protein n=1 Tax=Streptomyces sp. NPDC098789 TaxID=3366098 RepID=UPI00380354AC